jgi:hypothetical protein
MKTFLNVLFSIIFIMASATLISPILNTHPMWMFVALVFVSGIVKPKGVALMALQKEIWSADIIGNLFKDNKFAEKAYNADSFVLSGKVVHIPVAEAPSEVKKNLTIFPQAAVSRADNEVVYSIDTYYSIPRQIQNIEKYELSYDMRQSVVGEDERQLIQEAMNGLLYRWGPAAANVIETTGASSSTDLIDGTATGTRKLFTKDEFKKVAKKFANNNLGAAPKCALLTANHYYQLIDSLSDAERADVGRVVDMSSGIIGRYLGIDIMMRSTVLRYRKVAGVWTIIDEQVSFAAGTGDSAASLFFNPDSVERAVGDIEVFDNPGQAIYYGDIFSAVIRMGGRIRRTPGVYAVVEAIGT